MAYRTAAVVYLAFYLCCLTLATPCLPVASAAQTREVVKADDLYNPIWDQSRRDLPNTTHEDDEVLLASNFECGNGRNFRKLAEDRYAMDIEPEPGQHVYSGRGYYFCFAVRNKLRKPRTITIEIASVWPPGRQPHSNNEHVILKRGDRWSQLPQTHILPPPDKPGVVFQGMFRLELPAADEPDPVLFVSNYHWYAYTEMARYLKTLAAEHPDVRRSSIGKSAQGRDIWAVEVGRRDEDAPTITCAQTPQPSEMGHHACRAILDFLLSDDPIAAGILAKHRVCLIPHACPDGTVLGYAISNSLGGCPYFEGAKAIAGAPDAPVEEVAVWRYLQRKRPWLFIQWHSNHWASRPGHMLLRYDRRLVQDDDIRRLWALFDDRLDALPGNESEGARTSRTRGYTKPIGLGVATQLGGIPIMIKLHDKFVLKESMDHAVICFLAAIEAYDQWQDD